LRLAVKIFVLARGWTNVLVLLIFAQCNTIFYQRWRLTWLRYEQPVAAL